MKGSLRVIQNVGDGDPDPDPMIVMDDYTYCTMDEAVRNVSAHFGIEHRGGASGRGWSRYALLQRCPYLFKRSYIDGAQGHPGRGLEVGIAVHVLLALYYLRARDGEDVWPSPHAFVDELLDYKANPEHVLEAKRLFSAYEAYYDDHEVFLPIDAEVFAEDGLGNTCRFDLVAHTPGTDPRFPKGVYLVEHKTTSRFDQGTLEGWRNDGEVIQNIWVFTKGGYADKYAEYGTFRGVVVNLIGKQQQPKFHRTLIPVQAWQLNEHVKDMQFWRAQEDMYRAMGRWPRARNQCVWRYGLCELFDECAGDGEAL